MRIEISVDELSELLNLISPEKVEKIIELIAPAEPQEEPNPFWTGTSYPTEPTGTIHTPSTTARTVSYKAFNEQTK